MEGTKKKEPADQTAGPQRNGRRSPHGCPRKIVLTVKGSEAWKRWLSRMVRFSRLTATQVVDQSLQDYALKIGYRVRPPAR